MRPGGFRSVFEDSATIVLGGGGAEYPCPDIPTLDQHITDLHSRLAHIRTPELIAQLRRDIDLLLDRRIWLTLTATCAQPQDRRNA